MIGVRFFFNRYQYFLIQTLLLKGLCKYSQDIFELFWYVEMVNGVYGEKKTLDTKWARILKHNCKYVIIIIPVHS